MGTAQPGGSRTPAPAPGHAEQGSQPGLLHPCSLAGGTAWTGLQAFRIPDSGWSSRLPYKREHQRSSSQMGYENTAPRNLLHQLAKRRGTRYAQCCYSPTHLQTTWHSAAAPLCSPSPEKSVRGRSAYRGQLDLTANTMHTPTPHACQLEQAVFWKHLDTTLAFVCSTGGSKQAPSLRHQHQQHSGSRMFLPAGGSGQGSGTASEEERVLLCCAGLPAWPGAAHGARQDQLGDRHTPG